MIQNKMIIGYTTGVYDLFHIGHLNLLKNAKGICDKLIVGVTVDELVQYKGKKAMIPFEDRIEIVRSCKYVDAAVPQYDMDKLRACKELGASMLFVGDDWYGTEKWRRYEEEFAREGIKIVYFPYTKGISSTKITDALKQVRGWSNDYSLKDDYEFCMSSYLAFRYIIDDKRNFRSFLHHRTYSLIPLADRKLVSDVHDIEQILTNQFKSLKGKRLGLLLSGGMDSASLASYMKGQDAYTFRFLGGEYQKQELSRAENFARINNMTLHYVDIEWDMIQGCLSTVMECKGAPVHSIEPQVYLAARQAKEDGIELMVIGDAADYVFGGMDGLYAKDWNYDEFKNRYIYVDPKEILVNPVDMNFAFEKYRQGDKIDFMALMHEYTDIESYASYENAFHAAEMPFVDPYEVMIMAEELDLKRIRNGDSKYLIRDLFRIKYPDTPIPEKHPMPRPVDEYFKDWEGPKRAEFRKNIDINKYTGNQKWLLYCLERFLTDFCDRGY